MYFENFIYISTFLVKIAVVRKKEQFKYHKSHECQR